MQERKGRALCPGESVVTVSPESARLTPNTHPVPSDGAELPAGSSGLGVEGCRLLSSDELTPCIQSPRLR